MRVDVARLVAALLIIPAINVYSQDPVAEKYAQTITADDLSYDLHVLASDSLEGRETGKKGQKMAARFLASEFKKYGLQPPVKTDSGMSYFQKFELVKKEWEEVYLVVDKKKKVFLQDFYVYGDISLPKEEKLKVVFAGYGIDSPTYSDYTGLDVKGKAVIIFMGEPVKDGNSLVTGSKTLSYWANDWRRKAGAAKQKGAKCVFVIIGQEQKDFDARLTQLKHHLQQPTMGFTYKERPGSAFFVPVQLAAELLKTTEKELLNDKDTLGQTVKPVNLKLKSAHLKAKVKVKSTPVYTENVLGYIEGTDKKGEVLVITAHYDHLGKEGDKIFYGADDDGSGTSALMELAQAFGKAKQEGHPPRRSILIMPVTGEEKGLLGSEYYTDHPVFPLDSTVVDLNIDMIGRLDEAHEKNPNYVYLIGSNKLSTELHKISEEANTTYTHIDLDYKFNAPDDPNRFYYRSDHYNFAKNKIPVIFYFNGTHADYHQATDTVDKILFTKMEKITRLVFYTAWELANRDKRIIVDVNGD